MVPSQWRLVFLSFFFVAGTVLSCWISEGKQSLVSMFTQGVHSVAREVGPGITLYDTVIDNILGLGCVAL